MVQAVRCKFKATNNEAEYEALILGMQMAQRLKVRNLRVYNDLLLVVNHVNNEYVARDSKMIAYFKIKGQAESSNKIIVENLRKRLEELGGMWADELPLVLWSDRTTPKIATGQTPFSLVFGAEAVIPSEVLVPTHRYGCQTAEQNQIEMTRSLDTADELGESADIRMASYKQSVARTYNKNVNVWTLAVGDLVLKRVFENTKNHKAGKFAYKWE
ncbi:uncharacterized protein LOC141629375 [Silene latifolia]|uniref:uncharacterized protein LOC141629375 n=1 Tax=Silene latifolia TaxID=37657 RepID=UPI003D786889